LPQIVAQSYDGEKVMPGIFNGLQNKIKKNQYPYDIYAHCMAHKMNLILIDMCKYVKAMNIYTHLRSS
jgi:23S rRNA U2552 (ribose-2'-O)-methylase RlmE/FtsJ